MAFLTDYVTLGATRFFGRTGKDARDVSHGGKAAVVRRFQGVRVQRWTGRSAKYAL